MEVRKCKLFQKYLIQFGYCVYVYDKLWEKYWNYNLIQRLRGFWLRTHCKYDILLGSTSE